MAARQDPASGLAAVAPQPQGCANSAYESLVSSLKRVMRGGPNDRFAWEAALSPRDHSMRMSPPRASADFNFWGGLAAPVGRRTKFTRLSDEGELRQQGVEPAEGLLVTLSDYDASDTGQPLFLLNEGLLFWEAESARWHAAFDPDGFRWEPRPEE